MRLANQRDTSFHAGEGGVNGVVAIKPNEAIWSVIAVDNQSLNHRGKLPTAPCKYAASSPHHRPPAAFAVARPAAARTSSSDAAHNFANARPLALTKRCNGLQGQESKTPAR